MSTVPEKPIHVFEIKKNELLEKYNEIWDNMSSIIEKTFDIQLLFEKNI